VTAFDPVADADEIARLLGEYHRLHTHLETIIRSFEERAQRLESEHVPEAEFEVILQEAIPIIDERLTDIAERLRTVGVRPVTDLAAAGTSAGADHAVETLSLGGCRRATGWTSSL
jgi:hypothetical protein